MQQAQQLIAAKQHDKALKVMNDILSDSQPPSVAYYLRGTVNEQKQLYKDALDDFSLTISLTDPAKNIHERSQRKMYEICKQNCFMNCPKKYQSSNFPTYKMYQDLKQLVEDRKFLLSNNVDLQALQKHVEICRFDGEVQQKILTTAMNEGDYKQAKTALTVLKQGNQNYRFEITSLINLLELFEAMLAENYDQVFKLSKQLIQSNPDEPAYNLLSKIATFMQESFKVFENLTPNSDKTQKPEGLSKITNNIEKEKKQLEKAFNNLQNRISSVLSQILKLQQQQDISLEKISSQIYKQLDGLQCGAEYFNGFTQSCKSFDAQTSLSKYLKALILSTSLQQELKNLTRRYSKDEEVSDEIEQCDRQISVIHNLLKEVFDSKTHDDQFPQLRKFVDEVNSLSDKVLALQLKSMTPNFYRVLNVSRKATQSEIKKAYFKLAKEFHPDRVASGVPEEQKKKIAAQFQKIAEAYDVLSDEQKKQQYDNGGYGQDAKNQKQGNHQQRKDRAKQMVTKQEQPQFGGQQVFGGGGQQFFFGGDPFQFFQNFGFGGQQQQQQGQQDQGQQGGARRVRININGQDFFM